MLSAQIIRTLIDIRRCSPRETWARLMATVSSRTGKADAMSVGEWSATLSNPDHRWQLNEFASDGENVLWEEIAAAAAAIDAVVAETPGPTELIWTGPANGRFPVHRTDQTLYDLVAASQRRILLVTFAAHRIQHLCEHLGNALVRGVSLTLIVEAEDESDGQLTADAMNAFRGLPKEKLRVFYWPRNRREKNGAGRPGKLHAKCAVIDDIALIGSANLTDDAFNRNMELGALIRTRSVVESLVTHFEELAQKRILAQVK